jgi:transposase
MLSGSFDPKLSLFQLALGITAPWHVQDTTFSEKEGNLDIYLGCEKGSLFLCPLCQGIHPVHDYSDRIWRHLNFFQYTCHIHAPLPRVSCPVKDKATHTVAVPWARSGSDFTLLFEAFSMELANHMPLSVAERVLGIYDNRIMRIVKHYVSESRKKTDMSGVTTISLDETSKAKGHHYISVFSDLKQRKVLFAAEGRDHTVCEAFAYDLRAHGGDPERISTACIDLSKAFIKGVEEHTPHASIVFDKFHVIGYVNQAVDEVRRQEQKTNAELVGSRYAFLHSPENATEKQKAMLIRLSTMNLKSMKAYQIKLALRHIYNLRTPSYAEQKLKEWYFWATHSRLQPIIEAAKTIKRHWDGVVRYFKDRVTNGLAEGINGIIQTIKRQARGFKNTGNFITMIYLRLAKLEFDLPTVTGLASR